MPEQNDTDLKTTGNIVSKLISSPIYILKSIAKLKKRGDSNKAIKSESMGSPETDNEAGKNGNGKKEDVLVKAASNESVIPMGENRIAEHDESYKDF